VAAKKRGKKRRSPVSWQRKENSSWKLLPDNEETCCQRKTPEMKRASQIWRGKKTQLSSCVTRTKSRLGNPRMCTLPVGKTGGGGSLPVLLGLPKHKGRTNVFGGPRGPNLQTGGATGGKNQWWGTKKKGAGGGWSLFFLLGDFFFYPRQGGFGTEKNSPRGPPLHDATCWGFCLSFGWKKKGLKKLKNNPDGQPPGGGGGPPALRPPPAPQPSAEPQPQTLFWIRADFLGGFWPELKGWARGGKRGGAPFLHRSSLKKTKSSKYSPQKKGRRGCKQGKNGGRVPPGLTHLAKETLKTGGGGNHTVSGKFKNVFPLQLQKKEKNEKYPHGIWLNKRGERQFFFLWVLKMGGTARRAKELSPQCGKRKTCVNNKTRKSQRGLDSGGKSVSRPTGPRVYFLGQAGRKGKEVLRKGGDILATINRARPCVFQEKWSPNVRKSTMSPILTPEWSQQPTIGNQSNSAKKKEWTAAPKTPQLKCRDPEPPPSGRGKGAGPVQTQGGQQFPQR